MARRHMSRFLVLSLTLVVLLLAAPAALAAKPQITVTEQTNVFFEWEEEERECELGRWEIYYSDRIQTIEFPVGRMVVNGHFHGPFTFEAAHGVTYTGRFAGRFSEVLTNRAEVFNFSENITGRGDDGSRLRIQIRFKLVTVDGKPIVEIDDVRC
jgi:hypothetical protein